MTRMTGLVQDDDGAPMPGTYVSAELVGSRWLAGYTGQVDGWADGYTGPDGRWLLDLAPAAGLADATAWWRVRVWQRDTFGLNVPPPPVDGSVVDISAPGVLRDLEEPSTPPSSGGNVVLRSDIGRPGGVAGLGPDGQLAQMPELGDLEDVDTGPGGPEESVLVRDPDTGVWHSRPLSQVSTEGRGSTVWYVTQPPPHVLPEDWLPGDWVTVVAGEDPGAVYEITEQE